MATLDECEQALQTLSRRLADKNPSERKTGFDRTLSASIRDLKVVFGGRLHDGLLTDIAQTGKAEAQVRLDLTSDDLVSLVAGTLNLGSAWASGRIKVQAGMMDMARLRSIF